MRHIAEGGGGQREPRAVVQEREPAAGLQLRRQVLHGQALVRGPGVRTQVSEKNRCRSPYRILGIVCLVPSFICGQNVRSMYSTGCFRVRYNFDTPLNS